MALPIASRDLTATPLTVAEINLIIGFLSTNASGTAVNMVTGIGTVAPAFFTGLVSMLKNRPELEIELSHICSYPAVVLQDEYGNASPIVAY